MNQKHIYACHWLILVFLFGCTYISNKDQKMSNLSQQDWEEQLSKTTDAVILDVRTEEEFESGYIAGSKNIDIRGGTAFISSIEELDKSKAYFVYCRSGARSGQACQLMEQMGFEQVYNLEGGVLAWEGDLEE